MPLTTFVQQQINDSTPCIFGGNKVTFGAIKAMFDKPLIVVSAQPQVLEDVPVTHADVLCRIEVNGSNSRIFILPEFVQLKPLLRWFGSNLEYQCLALHHDKFVGVQSSRITPIDLSDELHGTEVVFGAIIVTDKKNVSHEQRITRAKDLAKTWTFMPNRYGFHFHADLPDAWSEVEKREFLEALGVI